MNVSAILPALNTPSSYVALGGIIAVCLSGFCRTAKASTRIEFIGLCACATGAMPVMKTLALAFHHW